MHDPPHHGIRENSCIPIALAVLTLIDINVDIDIDINIDISGEGDTVCYYLGDPAPLSVLCKCQRLCTGHTRLSRVCGLQDTGMANVLLEEQGLEVQMVVSNPWSPGDRFLVHCVEVNPITSFYRLSDMRGLLPSPDDLSSGKQRGRLLNLLSSRQ